MQSCFQLRYGNSYGTSFIWGPNKDQTVFVTAAHVVRGLHVGDNIQIATDNGWASIGVTGVWFHPDGHDVACISTANFKVETQQFDFRYNNAMLPGGQVKFLGFPHGLKGQYPGAGFPTPLVRTAFWSGVVEIEGKQIAIYDGFNNPGYSGGPIYAVDSQGQTSLAGVISGFRYEKLDLGQLYRKEPDSHEQEVIGHYVKPNSGMIYAVGSGDLSKLLKTVTIFNPSA